MYDDYDDEPRSTVFCKYADALKGAGPRLKELILHRSEREQYISFDEFLELCRIAYPEE